MEKKKEESSRRTAAAAASDNPSIFLYIPSLFAFIWVESEKEVESITVNGSAILFKYFQQFNKLLSFYYFFFLLLRCQLFYIPQIVRKVTIAHPAWIILGKSLYISLVTETGTSQCTVGILFYFKIWDWF